MEHFPGPTRASSSHAYTSQERNLHLIFRVLLFFAVQYSDLNFLLSSQPYVQPYMTLIHSPYVPYIFVSLYKLDPTLGLDNTLSTALVDVKMLTNQME